MLTLDRDHRFQEYHFHNALTLAEVAEKLGKRAIKLGLISSLTVHIFRDCWQFSLSKGQESELLTPEEAYLHFKKLVERADQSAHCSQI